ncbi:MULTISPECIES: hypothetical protein [Kitasatospora]|uniref:Uncharacterized protein n=1 Tax=Kitasatospora setae (strain ATCC 33774 / DSM 43861 / JCM 3304 / KCC A-0304 / NBRC 14216 / KM-6054) TaxID=452652 RepID=E4NJT6_KITSK|nr:MULTISPECIES: hypothetical protein [Kitasatospora]BAJ33234.1 hypothetical protein KSE_74790 [Kitasatospora setae KM-6054]
MAQRTSGYWRTDGGRTVPVSRAEALDAWGAAAYPLLVGVASRYHDVITYSDLGAAVQRESGVQTSVLLHNWIGRVLSRVIPATLDRAHPPLTALVVHTDDGMVGEGYREVLEAAGLPPAADAHARELHAAEARLACYRVFCPDLPPGGGTAALAPLYHQAVQRRRAAATERPAPVCPRCRVQLPATRICDTCS